MIYAGRVAEITEDHLGNLVTRGTVRGLEKGLRLSAPPESLRPAGRGLVFWLARRLEAGESLPPTVAYGTGLLSLRSVGGDGWLDICENTGTHDAFEPGGVRTLTAWTAQRSVCFRAGSLFLPPHPSEIVVVVAGAANGGLIMTRTTPADDDSGWRIESSRLETGSRLRVGAFLAQNPGAIPFAALAPGHRVDLKTSTITFSPSA